MSEIADFIVVGSGPSGAIAAKKIASSGASVAMLDVGHREEKEYSDLVPNESFIKLRKTDPRQIRYFLGDDFEAVQWGSVKIGAQLTPARFHMVHGVEKLTPILSTNFYPMESLAYGGLSVGWGLGCYVYSSRELEKTGLQFNPMQIAYQVVADWIGISAENSDFSRYVTGNISNLQFPLRMDNAVEQLYSRYQKSRSRLQRKGIFFGFPSMALLTEKKENREATTYRDMDFYDNKGLSAWRSCMMVDELRSLTTFLYLPRMLVTRFREEANGIMVSGLHTDTLDEFEMRCKTLVLAAGALGTARIVMRSIRGISRLPLLSNPYAYVPCLNIGMIGRTLSEHKTSMAQAMMIYDPDGKNADVVSVAVYTYRSLLLFKLAKEVPLNMADSLKLMKILHPAFLIAGIHHPDEPSDQKYVELQTDSRSLTGDRLFANYALSSTEIGKIKSREKTIRKVLRDLQCYPLKRIDPGFGGSIHYAGTVPFSNKPQPGRLHTSGRLHETRRVYIADSSGFNYLPAKGITLTIMANAYNVALNAMKLS